MRMAVGSDERTPLTDAVVEELRSRGVTVELGGPCRKGLTPTGPT